MAKHEFRVTIEADPARDDVSPVVFNVSNHDDILGMIARFNLTEDHDRAFFVGLKLLGEAMLEDRKNPLYAEFLPQFAAFMKRLKAARQA
ncbi:DUF3861 family protein [Phaeovulum vinaykumarii]|uniref:DUF3861 family protein n=1 Tax=Phaeovulum vinaykumarii TaxID=407234 RepID=A0A1N7L6K8_9RHOB|nr:DUF3861 family protein [Phaeovulum vinaykumarii]SIS69431.1 protein of unknown function [Phaeovulum vinaykumarii]SOB99493.1 uncharacterized protein DUF3861 [Phaeovulum vinaykumarii]